MELWIRTQDKLKLVKVNYVYAMKNKINSFSIYGETVDSAPIIGRYETKERAIEVLDEIQDKMLNGAFAKKINGLGEELDLIPNPILIYNMPER